MVAGWWLSRLVGAESGVKGFEGSKMGICSDLSGPSSFSGLGIVSHYLIINPDLDIPPFFTCQIWQFCQYWKGFENVFV